jgi:hypothetical protein
MLYTFNSDDIWQADLFQAVNDDGCDSGDKLHFVLPDGRIVRARVEAVFKNQIEYNAFRAQRTDEGPGRYLG